MTILEEWQARKDQEALHRYRHYEPVISGSHFVWDEVCQCWLYCVEMKLGKPYSAAWEARGHTRVMNAIFRADTCLNQWIQGC